MSLTKDMTIVLLLTEPTKTLKDIFSRGTNNSEIFLLVAIASLFQMTKQFWRVSRGMSLPSSLWVSALLGILLGYIFAHIIVAMLVFSARIFNGNANFKSTLIALAWSFLPLVISVIFYILAISVYGTELLRKTDTASDIHYARYAIEVLRYIVGIWSLVILYKGIKLINNFSTWKAIGTIAVTLFLMVIIPFVVLLLTLFAK